MVVIVVALAAYAITAGHAAQTFADEEAADALVALNFPPDLELKVFVEYVSQRLGINILYDEQIANRRITIRAPQQVPRSSLLDLLQSALKVKGLALIDGDQPGWKRVVVASNLLPIAGAPVTDIGNLADTAPSQAVSQMFFLKHVDTRRVDAVVKPFITQPGGNLLVIAEQNIVIVSDYANNMTRIAQMIELIDQAGEPVLVEFMKLEYLEASTLSQQVRQLLLAKQKVAGETVDSGLDLSHDPRTNQIIIVGTQRRITDAKAMITSLDVPLGLSTKIYQFTVASPERVDRLVRQLIDPLEVARLYRSAIDRESNLLVVTAPNHIHDKVASLRGDMDVMVDESQTPVRFYKLANATATEVLQTIRSIEGTQGLRGISTSSPSGESYSDPNLSRSVERTAMPQTPENLAGNAIGSTGPGGIPGAGAGGLRPVSNSVQTERATVTADINTNTIIVVAPPAEQRIYEELIKRLDRRRPQVLIEITLVTLDTSENYSFGVEISRNTKIDGGEVLTFSSFGLSAVDKTTGALTINPGLGFNGAIIAPDIANIIIRALKTNGRSKVVSAPKLLVNDNATGSLSSVSEQPFTSVNASDTVATTSFGGFVSAGTEITVTPHISEGEHLNLDFTVTLNNFSGEASNGVPPPRQTNAVQSQVTIPDGHTIIVGGLNSQNFSETITRVPLLGEIPGLEYLFSSRTTSDSNITFFVFIRPIILRDDKFEDLKYLSQRDMEAAGQPADFPTSDPITLR